MTAETISGTVLILDEAGGIPGDGDADGKVTSNDARMILQKVVGK